MSEKLRPRIVVIAAHDRQRAIGRNGQLPWHLPDDLQRFKALTSDKTLLMGRKTAQSLGRALPKRRNLVLTRAGRVPFAGMEPVASLDAALKLAGEELCVIGGGALYALALPLADVLHLTLVNCDVVDADAFFPEFDSKLWTEIAREAHSPDTRHAHAFEFVQLMRKKS